MKHNLAKVLGLEQLTDERVTFNPSQDEIEQTQVKEFHQYLEDHQQATDVALEAISSAHAYGQIIQKNNSTDKTTYELLKVAVEQLKEKTGVYTQGMALESTSSISYKQESLQDIKDFIKKVWEAIKKAFFAMINKVKAFVESLFDKSKKTKQTLDEAKDAAEEFSKEVKNAPKTEKEGGDYDSQYFKNSKESPAFIVDEKISQYIGTEKKSDFTFDKVSEKIGDFYDELADYVHELKMINLYGLLLKYTNGNRDYLYQRSKSTPSHTDSIDNSKFNKELGGALGPAIKITFDDTAETSIDIQFKEAIRYVAPINPLEMEVDDDIFHYLMKIQKLSEDLLKDIRRIEPEMNEFFKEQQTTYDYIKSDDTTALERVKEIKANNERFLGAARGVFLLKTRLNAHMEDFVKCFSDYIKENISYYKAHIAADLKSKNYVEPKDFEKYYKENN